MSIPRSLTLVQQSLREGTLSIRELVTFYFDQCDKWAQLNAFLHVFEEDKELYISKIDAKLQRGEQLGKLFGLVISIKDNICYEGHPSSAGSKILEGYKSPFSATAVARLISEDAFIIGSTNCDEFGMGSASINPHYGPVSNGHWPDLVSGGSSGGSAVSVQMDMCMASLGSDTGGSVRQPAAFTKTIGFKPTYGAVSRYGLIAYGSSFDQIGLLGHDADTLAAIYDVISGYDPHDMTSGIKHSAVTPDKKPKLGILNGFTAGDGPVMQDYTKVLEVLESQYDIVSFDFPYKDLLIPCYYILATAEASSNLSRYDGVRYGRRASSFNSLEEMYVHTRSEGFGSEVKKRIMLGAFVLSEGYQDAYFTQAQKVRKLIQSYIDDVFNEVDFILSPASANEPWPIDSKPSDPTEVYMSDIYTTLANLGGYPAICIPLSQKEGISKIPHLQIMASRGSDKALFQWCKMA